jgi:hypothetical protein
VKHSSEGLPLYCSGCTYRFTVFHFISHLDLNPFFFTIVLIDLISPRYVHVICLSNFFLLWFEKGFFLLIFCFNFFFVALCELFWHSPFLGFATNYLLSRSRDELSHYFENDELHGVYADTHTDTHTQPIASKGLLDIEQRDSWTHVTDQPLCHILALYSTINTQTNHLSW